MSLWHIVFTKILNIRTFNSAVLQDFSLCTKILSSRGGKITLKKHIHTKRGVVFEADGGSIEVGEGVFFNNGCMVVSKESIRIGEYTSFGPNVLIYDHDHNIHSAEEIHDSGFLTDAVTIGNNVWVGANTVILRGTHLGDGCVVGAGSVIKGTYPPDSVIIQKRTENITVKKRRKEAVIC